jgi:MarR family transcriptional regulator for hemolysin
MDSRSNKEIRADLSFLFDKASQSLAARMTDALAAVDLTPRGYCVLSKAVPGKLTQGEIAEIALLDKTTMVVTMDHLEGAGLARRVPSPTDRRARLVETTAEGERTVAAARSIIDGVFADVLGVLTEQQREVFLDAMVVLVGAGGPLSGEVRTESAPRRRSSRTV